MRVPVFQKAAKGVRKLPALWNRAFPDHQNAPPKRRQYALDFFVTSFVPHKLWQPKIQAGFGEPGAYGAIVAAPETPMDEDGFSP
jgi:hypothetical protein